MAKATVADIVRDALVTSRRKWQSGGAVDAPARPRPATAPAAAPPEQPPSDTSPPLTLEDLMQPSKAEQSRTLPYVQINDTAYVAFVRSDRFQLPKNNTLIKYVRDGSSSITETTISESFPDSIALRTDGSTEIYISLYNDSAPTEFKGKKIVFILISPEVYAWPSATAAPGASPA